jgi:hypothetical protein
METPGGKKGAPGIPNKPSKPGAGKPYHRLQKEAAANNGRAGPAYSAAELQEAGRKGKKGSWNPNPKPLSAKQLKAAEKAALKAAKKSSKQTASAASSSAYAAAAAAEGSDDGAGDEPEVQVTHLTALLTLKLFISILECTAVLQACLQRRSVAALAVDEALYLAVLLQQPHMQLSIPWCARTRCNTTCRVSCLRHRAERGGEHLMRRQLLLRRGLQPRKQQQRQLKT